jgi:hypothetical protein
MRTKVMEMDIKSVLVPIHNDIIALKIGDKNELIDLRLFKENPGGEDIQLFAGRIIVKEVLEETQPVKGSSWKKVAEVEVLMDLEKRSAAVVPILKYDCQYRFSEFTRMPQGKLEVILARGLDLKYSGESFRPILEFRVGNQRVVQDELVNPTRAQWKNSLMIFDTHSWWELFEMRIYVEQETLVGGGAAINSLSGKSKVSSLHLLGCYVKPLHAIYYNDDNANRLEVELRIVSEELGGQIQLHFEYFPRQAGQEKTTLQLSQVKEGAAKSGDPAAVPSSGPKFEKRAGVCYLQLMGVQVQGVTSRTTNYSVENIRVEVSYGDQRLLSRITTDLQKTGNQEIMNDRFKLFLDEIPGGGKLIRVRAFDIDYASEKKSTQTLVGASVIDGRALRRYQGKEFHYHCAIKISEAHLSAKLKKGPNNNKDEAMDGLLSDARDEAARSEHLRRLRKLADQEEDNPHSDPRLK